MGKFEETMQKMAEDQRVPSEVKAKFFQTLQTLPDHKTVKTKSFNRIIRRGSVIAATFLLVVGTVYAAERSGLFEYLSQVIGVSDRQVEIQEVTEVQTTGERGNNQYGPLWNITEGWNDGAKLYFEAIVPKTVAENRKLDISPSDHCVVNEKDCMLNFDISEEEKYICSIDISELENTSVYDVEIRLKLLRNQYNWDEYDLTTDPNSPYDYSEDVSLEEEQTLRFALAGDSIARSGWIDSTSIAGAEVNVSKALLSPSTLKLKFTYRITGDQAEQKINEAGLASGFFYIEDTDGNRIDTLRGRLAKTVSDVYTDENGYLCRDYEIDTLPVIMDENDEMQKVQLSTETTSINVVPFDGEWDEEGRFVPGTDVELGWGGFSIVFVRES